MYFTSQLIEFSNHTDICNAMQIVIIPSANPDGYIHSYTNDRMWRKTRSANDGTTCIGTDPNRNFGHEWGGQGASTNPCTETYRGRGPFSEVEAQIVRDVINSYGSRVIFYTAIHTYGRYLLYPWGYSSFSPPEEANFRRVADAGYFAAVDHNGARYTVGGAAAALYPAAGGSDDYAFAAGVPISLTLECAGMEEFLTIFFKFNHLVTIFNLIFEKIFNPFVLLLYVQALVLLLQRLKFQLLRRNRLSF